jgi:hypothetical protein
LVEGLGEEDEIGAVGCGGLDVDAAELDVFGVDAFGLWVGEEVLPRMWWMEEKEEERRVTCRIIINLSTIHHLK